MNIPTNDLKKLNNNGAQPLVVIRKFLWFSDNFCEAGRFSRSSQETNKYKFLTLIYLKVITITRIELSS